MPYTPQTWIDAVTQITAARMLIIENAIQSATATAEAVVAALTGKADLTAGKVPVAQLPAATNTEATTGTSTAVLVTPAALKAVTDALVGAAPSTLNTLAEIATAIGNDPAFSATLATALTGKQPRIQKYTTMPDSAALAAMPANTVFFLVTG